MRKTTTLLLLAGMLSLTGCTTHYVITKNSGGQIATKGKPHLKNGVYTYTDLSGKPGKIPAGSVAEVAPASMSGDESKTKFKSPSQD
jgi:Bacterial protein of unknown function (DUF903)